MLYCKYINFPPPNLLCLCILTTAIESAFLVFQETWWFLCNQLCYSGSDFRSRNTVLIRLQFWKKETNWTSIALPFCAYIYVYTCVCLHTYIYICAQLLILTNIVWLAPPGNGAINQLIMGAKLSTGHLIHCQNTQSHVERLGTMLCMGWKLIFLNTKWNSEVIKYACFLLSFAVCSETSFKVWDVYSAGADWTPRLFSLKWGLWALLLLTALVGNREPVPWVSTQLCTL